MQPVLDYIFGWEVFSFGVGILLVAGSLLVADEFKEFTAARVCFALTAVWIVGKMFMWCYLTNDSFYTRALVTFVVVGLVGVGASEGMRLIGEREARSEKNLPQQAETKKP